MMRKFSLSATAALALVTSAAPALAQTEIPDTPYIRFDTDLADTPQGGFVELTNPTDIFRGTGSSALFGSAQSVQIPFDFKFYDDEINEFRVYPSGGALKTSPGSQFTTFNWAPGDPSRSPNGFIAGLWGTVYLLGAPADGAVTAQVQGTTGSRVVVFEFLNHADSSGTCCYSNLYSWQIRLHEGPSGRIDIDFRGDTSGPNSTGNPTATSGMEDNQGNRPIEFMPGSPNINGSSWINTLSGKRITLIQDPGVELIGVNMSAPEFGTLGAPIEIPVSFANLNGNFTPQFQICVDASTDRNFGQAAQIFEDIGCTRLQAAPYRTINTNVVVTFPEEAGTQRFFLRARVDSEDDLMEVDETNNTIFAEDAIRLLPSRPDLLVGRVSGIPRDAEPGDRINVNVRVQNVGATTTENAVVAVVLSSNPAISPQDSEIGRFTRTLDPGQTADVSVEVALPPELNSGSYYVGAFADIDKQFEESNEANNGAAALNQIAISGGDVVVLTERVPGAIVGEPFNALLTAVGGDGTYLWKLADEELDNGASPCPNPQLPEGICLDRGTGRFFGNCAEQASVDITVEASSEGFQSGTRQYNFRCVDPELPLTIVTRSVPDGIVGKEYSFEVVVTGGQSADRDGLTFSAAGLPEGLEVTANGVIAGTPMEETGPDGANVTLSVGDGVESDDQPIRLVVNPNQNLLIDVAVLPMAELGTPYSAQITAQGGVGDIIFSRDSGELPNGLVLNPDGTLTGIPDQVGTFSFVVRATDSPGGGALRAVDRNEFVIEVVDAADGFQIVTEALPVGVVGEGYSAVVSAVGGVPELTWELDRSIPLPEGLQAVQTQGSQELTITGAPDVSGTRNLLVSVTDRLDRTLSKVLVLEILEEPREARCPDPNDARCELVVTEDGGGCTHTDLGSGLGAGSLAALVLLGGLILRRRRED